MKLGCGVVKGNGLGLQENPCFFRRTNLEKMVRSWRGCHSRNPFREISDDLLNILNHVKRDTARRCEIDVHTEEVMNRTTGDREGFIRGFIPLLKPSSELGDDIMIFMANEEVINMPADSYLVTIYHLIGNTWVVEIENKTNGAKVRNQFSIK